MKDALLLTHHSAAGAATAAFSLSHLGEYVTSTVSSLAASTKSCKDKPPMACVVTSTLTSL